MTDTAAYVKPRKKQRTNSAEVRVTQRLTAPILSLVRLRLGNFMYNYISESAATLWFPSAGVCKDISREQARTHALRRPEH